MQAISVSKVSLGHWQIPRALGILSFVQNLQAL